MFGSGRTAGTSPVCVCVVWGGKGLHQSRTEYMYPITNTHTHLEDVGGDGGGGSLSYLPQHLTVELVLEQRVKQTRCDDVLHGADVVVQTRKLD